MPESLALASALCFVVVVVFLSGPGHRGKLGLRSAIVEIAHRQRYSDDIYGWCTRAHSDQQIAVLAGTHKPI